MTHIMLDLETWGTRPGCAIRSVGAVIFDPRARVLNGEEFYANVDGESCLRAGLTLDLGTAEWWEEQSVEARAHLKQDPLPLEEVLHRFTAFAGEGAPVYIWGHGASFDPPILEEAYRRFFLPAPWAFWNIRDTRTAYDMAGVSLGSFPRQGDHHNALDDAKHQALVLQAAYNILGVA